ncbi:hypothetical protein [Brucella pseudogrignonensis]|uniref:hypothetical protein n=1 Tax=Brucella pseudogrignonensis TaxID=419475 RepID=UPI0038D2519F
MKVGRGVEVFNLYDWLPGHGENGVKINIKGTDLIVNVEYDGEYGVVERSIIFTSVCSFYHQIFPGPSIIGLDWGAKSNSDLIGSLVEYPASEAAIAWMKALGNSRVIRQFGVLFLAENIQIIVLSGDVILEDPVVG